MYICCGFVWMSTATTSYNVLFCFFFHWNVESRRWMAYFHIVHVMHSSVFFHIIIIVPRPRRILRIHVYEPLPYASWLGQNHCCVSNRICSLHLSVDRVDGATCVVKSNFILLILFGICTHLNVQSHACTLYNIEWQAEAPSYCRRRMLHVDPTIIIGR